MPITGYNRRREEPGFGVKLDIVVKRHRWLMTSSQGARNQRLTPAWNQGETSAEGINALISTLIYGVSASHYGYGK